jgi:hypothetical protein
VSSKKVVKIVILWIILQFSDQTTEAVITAKRGRRRRGFSPKASPSILYNLRGGDKSNFAAVGFIWITELFPFAVKIEEEIQE